MNCVFSLFRPNIFLEVTERPPTSGQNHPVEASYNAVLSPVLQEALQERLDYPKTIVYMPLQWCSHAHSMACQLSHLSLDQPDEIRNGQLDGIFAQFHALQGKKASAKYKWPWSLSYQVYKSWFIVIYSDAIRWHKSRSTLASCLVAHESLEPMSITH